MPVPVPVPVPARTLPNLQVSYIPTYLLYAGTTSAGNHSFIHSSTPSLPPSRLPAWYMSVSVPVRPCVRVRPCISVYLSVCMYIHTYNTLAYPQKVHIKGTNQRYISKIHVHVYLGVCGCFFVFLKIYLPIRSTQKTTRTNVRAPALSFTTSLGEFLCASQSKISLSNWRPKTTVCLASYLR